MKKLVLSDNPLEKADVYFKSPNELLMILNVYGSIIDQVHYQGEKLPDDVLEKMKRNFDWEYLSPDSAYELINLVELPTELQHKMSLSTNLLDQKLVHKHDKTNVLLSNGSGAKFACYLHSSILSDKKRGIVRMNYFKGRHFQQDIIIVAVGYYFRFSLSYRDIVELLRDRGVSVHHTTVMRWVHHYGPIFKALWRQHQTSHTKSWRIDETYINVKGHWTYLYRAIDSNGLTLDFELRKHRDYAAAYHFLKRLLTTNGRPDRLVTDQYRATLKAVKHLMKQDYLSKSAHQCSKYRNNLIEQDHRFIKRHRVRSASFQSIRTASATLSGIEVIHALRKKTRRELSLIGFSAVAELKAIVAA